MAYELSELTKLSDMKNLESPLLSVTSKMESGQTLTAILQVRQEGYVPEGVTVRAAISDVLFTAEFSEELLAELEKDPLVKSVALARPQYLATAMPTENPAEEEMVAEETTKKKTSAKKSSAKGDTEKSKKAADAPKAKASAILVDCEPAESKSVDEKPKKSQKRTKSETP